MTRRLRTTALVPLLLATGVPRPALAGHATDPTQEEFRCDDHYGTPDCPADDQECEAGPDVLVGELSFRLSYCGATTRVHVEHPTGQVSVGQVGAALGHMSNVLVAVTTRGDRSQPWSCETQLAEDGHFSTGCRWEVGHPAPVELPR